MARRFCLTAFLGLLLVASVHTLRPKTEQGAVSELDGTGDFWREPWRCRASMGQGPSRGIEANGVNCSHCGSGLPPNTAPPAPAVDGASNNTVAERPKAASPAHSTPPSSLAPTIDKRTAAGSTCGAPRPTSRGATTRSALHSIVSGMRTAICALSKVLSNTIQFGLPALNGRTVVLLSPSGQRMGLRKGPFGSTVVAMKTSPDEAHDKFVVHLRGGNRVALLCLGIHGLPLLSALPGGLLLPDYIHDAERQEYEVVSIHAGKVAMLRAHNGAYLWAVHWAAYQGEGFPLKL